MGNSLGPAGRRHSKPGSSAAPPDSRTGDVNFSSIVSLDSAGGWHILNISSKGELSADTAGHKILRQFFPDDTDWAQGMPAPFAAAFCDCREWGLQRTPATTSRSLAFVRQGVKLAVHYIPNSGGGYILMKTGSAVQRVDLSAWPLTGREKEVATLVAAGKTNVEIGILLHISMRTVQKHLENVFRKLGVETRMALAMRLSA